MVKVGFNPSTLKVKYKNGKVCVGCCTEYGINCANCPTPAQTPKYIHIRPSGLVNCACMDGDNQWWGNPWYFNFRAFKPFGDIASLINDQSVTLTFFSACQWRALLAIDPGYGVYAYQDALGDCSGTPAETVNAAYLVFWVTRYASKITISIRIYDGGLNFPGWGIGFGYRCSYVAQWTISSPSGDKCFCNDEDAVRNWDGCVDYGDTLCTGGKVAVWAEDCPVCHISVCGVSEISCSPPTGGQKVRVQFTVVDENSNPIEGAEVYFTLSGALSESANATTNASGVATWESDCVCETGLVTATVDNVIASGYEYDSNENICSSDNVALTCT